jgi:hypothetical protein
MQLYFQRLWIEDVITQLKMKNQRPQMKTFCLVAFYILNTGNSFALSEPELAGWVR